MAARVIDGRRTEDWNYCWIHNGKPGNEDSDRSIDLAVSRLRQKLNVSGHASHLIKTVRGEGYIFDATIDP